MNMTFLFWMAAVYTVALFGAQVAELVTHRRIALHVSTANTLYIAILSVYVGSKEVKRWKEDDDSSPSPSPRLAGEWFVGLWVLFLLAATFMSQLWPARFVYPEGLTLIAFEVFGFYAGSSASRWLHARREQGDRDTLVETLDPAAPKRPIPPAQEQRISRKRQRYEQLILEEVRVKGFVSRQVAERLLGLSTNAAWRILKLMVDRGLLLQQGGSGHDETRYVAGPASQNPPPASQ